MSSIRPEDAASRAQAKLHEEQAGLGQGGRAGRADASHQAHALTQTQDSAQAGEKKKAGGADALEAGEGAGFKNRWARELAPRPASEAKGASQDQHDSQAREATETQKLSDFLKTEQQKRV